MRRMPALAALCLLLPFAAEAQTSRKKSQAKKPASSDTAAAADPAQPAAQGQAAAQPQGGGAAPDKGAADKAAADQAEFRRQVMEEVDRRLKAAEEQMKQREAWIDQDSAARVQDSEAVESLRQKVNLFQPHGYLRMRSDFMYNFDLGRGRDPAKFTIFPTPYIGTGGNHSQSEANMRFRFEPTFAVSEDMSIYLQADILDNIVLGTDPVSDPYIDPFTPLNTLSSSRLSSTVNVKRAWGRVNTQLGEFLFGRMGYHWGLGILHNDGNCLDCDYGDTYDRIAFSPREIKGHTFTLMFDLITKGPTTTGEFGELGRSVDLDTLDDGYQIGLSVTKLDTPESARRKLAAGEWVVNYGAVFDYRNQGWDTIASAPAADPYSASGVAAERAVVVKRGAKFYQPDVFLSLKKSKWRFDMEFASNIGNVDNRASKEVDVATNPQFTQGLTFLQFGMALQTDVAMLPADALLLGLEAGGASGDAGAYGFGARPWRNGSGTLQPTVPGIPLYSAAGPGDIDGNHISFPNTGPTHGRVNNFVFNRAFNVDMILYRNLITAVTSSWYVKPSLRYRPTGRRSAGGDDTGFELFGSLMYASAWYAENTPGLKKPLGLELDAGITYDTSDRLHTGLGYGLLIPFSGLEVNPSTVPGQPAPNVGLAHNIKFIIAIPF
jgi:uncharacterized protein (TIGR04551 family)